MKIISKEGIPVLKNNMSVATKLVKEGKVRIAGYDVGDLLKSPAVNAFLKQGSQEATLVGDHIVRFDGTMPYRVITKRLPNGDIVSKGFGGSGQEADLFELCGKNGRKAWREYNHVVVESADKDTVALLCNANGKCIQSQHLNSPNFRPNKIQVEEKAVGLTELANKNNPLYATLKNSGMIRV